MSWHVYVFMTYSSMKCIDPRNLYNDWRMPPVRWRCNMFILWSPIMHSYTRNSHFECTLMYFWSHKPFGSLDFDSISLVIKPKDAKVEWDDRHFTMNIRYDIRNRVKVVSSNGCECDRIHMWFRCSVEGSYTHGSRCNIMVPPWVNHYIHILIILTHNIVELIPS